MKQNEAATQIGLPQVFVCTFCKQEFEQMGSVFSHMKEVHGTKLAPTNRKESAK